MSVGRVTLFVEVKKRSEFQCLGDSHKERVANQLPLLVVYVLHLKRFKSKF